MHGLYVHILWSACLPWRLCSLRKNLDLFEVSCSKSQHVVAPVSCYWVPRCHDFWTVILMKFGNDIFLASLFLWHLAWMSSPLETSPSCHRLLTQNTHDCKITMASIRPIAWQPNQCVFSWRRGHPLDCALFQVDLELQKHRSISSWVGMSLLLTGISGLVYNVGKQIFSFSSRPDTRRSRIFLVFTWRHQN